MTHTLEIATFRATLSPAFLATRETAMSTLAAHYEGFLSSRLIVRDDGTASDQVVWASRAEAERAGAEAAGFAEVAAYFSQIDEVLSMEHADIVQE